MLQDGINGTPCWRAAERSLLSPVASGSFLLDANSMLIEKNL